MSPKVKIITDEMIRQYDLLKFKSEYCIWIMPEEFRVFLAFLNSFNENYVEVENNKNVTK